MHRSKQFLDWNRTASQRLDRLFGIGWESIRADEARVVESLIFPGAIVADVGGGKKPFYPGGDARLGHYVGLDIDLAELQQAPDGSYDRTEICDITCPPVTLLGQFDVIICNNTLEHVRDAERGLQGLTSMLKPGGKCYLAVPCRLAPFAWLNRRLPEGFKKTLLRRLIPAKSGDGFKAYYDKATPSSYERMVRELGAEVFYEKRFYWSSYFTLFVPAFVAWRAYSVIARRVSPDYCERFHLAFTRSSEATRPVPRELNPVAPGNEARNDTSGKADTNRAPARSRVAKVD